MSPKAKSVAIAISLGSFSAMLLVVGEIGPLTPSEGRPSTASLAIFAFLPILLTFVAAIVSKDWIVRIALLAESAWFLKITLDMLRLFGMM
jgi:hypothetical protein